MSFDLRLVRYGPAGEERPGLIDDDGRLRDLSYVLMDIQAEALDPDEIDILRAIEPATLPLVPATPRLAAPVNGARITAIDGASCLLRPIAVSDRPDGAPARMGLAALNGAPARVTAYTSALVADDRSWAALGPWLVAFDPPLRPSRLKSAGRPLGFTAQTSILQSATAEAGDVSIVLCDPSTPSGAWIDGFGPPQPLRPA